MRDPVDDVVEEAEGDAARYKSIVAPDDDTGGGPVAAVVVVVVVVGAEGEGIVIGGARTALPATSETGAPGAFAARRTVVAIFSGGGMTGIPAAVPEAFFPFAADSNTAASTGGSGRDGGGTVAGEGGREEAVEGEVAREELPVSSTSWLGVVPGRARRPHSSSP